MSQTASTIAEASGITSKREPLPKGWRWAKLKDVCIKITDGTHRSPPNGGKGIPYITAKNIRRFKIDLTNLTYVSQEDHAEIYKRCDPQIGDVLYIKDGATMGIAAVNDLDFEFSMLSSVALLRPHPHLLRSFFLTAWLNHPDTYNAVIDTQLGSAIKRMVLNQIVNIQIPIPPIAEQERIEQILIEQMTAVERARAAAEAQLKAANDLPAAYLRAVFDDAESQGWQFVKVGDISSLIIDGPHVTPMYVSKGVPFVTVRNIVNRRVDLSKVSFITEADHAEFIRRGKAEKGDILYTKDGTLGIPCIVDTDEVFSFFVSVALIKLIRERADPRFVAYVLESPAVLKQVELLGAGAGLKHMVLRSIRALEIPLPPLHEQRKIAVTLNEQMVNAEKTKKILSDQINSINKLPAALLRQAFTGKL